MKKGYFVLIAVLALLLVVPNVVRASALTIRDIPTAYDDKFDTVGFESATAGGDSFTVTGEEIILIQNNNSGDSTVTINSVADDLGRTNDLNDTVPGNSVVMVGPMEREGWEDGNGNITTSYPDGVNMINIAIIRLQ